LEKAMSTERWQIDSSHSGIHFTVRHLVIAKVRGQFSRWTGTLEAPGTDFARASVGVVIDASSIDTGVADRDAHLRSADFLDVETHPKIVFRSSRVDGAHRKEGDRFRIEGQLEIRGKALPVTLEAAFEGLGGDPWGKQRAGFTARTEIDRREWGLRWNQALETGGVLVANAVKIEIEAQAVKQEQAARQETGAGASG
jgi:polyisoprenoid-binding protein YceI